MSLRRSIEQLRPARIPKQDVQEKVQSFLTEITISPHYQQKGVYNPFYELDIDIETDIRPEVGPGEITFANVKSGTGKLIKSYGRGKFHFQIHVDNKKSKYYVITTAKVVKSHLGMTKRKSSTASSDVNEYLSLYFIYIYYLMKEYLNIF